MRVVQTIAGPREVPDHMDFPHTDLCHLQSIQAVLLELIFTLEHPGWCTNCGATGAIHSFGSYDEPESYDACYACADAGKCSACGQEVFDIDDPGEECPACGWTFNGGPFAPGYHECLGECLGYDYMDLT